MGSASKETIRLGSMLIDFIVDAEDSDGSATVFECFVPAASKAAIAHSNDAFEETIYGLEGTCTWTVDGQTHEIGPGDCLCIRRGQVHGFENRTSGDVKMLAISTPGVFGPAYFRELADVLAASGPPDTVAVGALMSRHGLSAA